MEKNCFNKLWCRAIRNNQQPFASNLQKLVLPGNEYDLACKKKLFQKFNMRSLYIMMAP